MTDRIQVRPITEADIGSFHAAVDAVARESRFLRRTEGPGLEAASEFVRGNIRERNPQVVAMDGETLVGWCDVVRSSGSCEQHVGTLGMGVLVAWRGKGLSRRLINAALDEAATLGIWRVALTVHASNEKAIALYRSTGFEVEGFQKRARDVDGRFEDVLLMARLDLSITRLAHQS